MANDKILPEGIRVFDKHANAPDFVVATVVVSPDALVKFCKDNAALLSDYQGTPQLRLQLLKSQAGKLYMTVDTYKRPEGGAQPGYAPTQGKKPVERYANTSFTSSDNDLPF